MRKNLTNKLSKPGIKLRGFSRMNWGSRIAIIVLILVALSAIFAPLLAPHPPEEVFYKAQPPSAEHLFGTDHVGRDVLSRLPEADCGDKSGDTGTDDDGFHTRASSASGR